MNKQLSVTPLAEFRDQLSDRKFVSRFNAARSDDSMKIAAERSFALELIKKDERLQSCSPAAIHNALLDVSFVGLSLSPVLSYCYLIAYYDKERRIYTPSVKVSYRGLLNLCFRANSLKDVQADTVNQNDPVFKVRRTIVGTDFEHIQARKDRGEITHAYCVASFTTGGHHFEVMDAEQLAAVERFAKSKGGGQAWSGPFRGEQCKKTVIRRAWKSWPADPALRHAAEVMDRFEPVDPVVIEKGVPVSVLSKKQISTAVDLASAYNVPLAKVCAAFNVESLEQIPADRFEELEFVIKRRAS